MSKDKKPEKEKAKPKTRVESIDAELEAIDAERIALKERGAALMAEKKTLMIEENLLSKFLTASPLSTAEQDYIDDNPDVWKKIKEDNKGKRGSRKGQVMQAGGNS